MEKNKVVIMNFTIPRTNNLDMLCYIWKILDLPYISYNDLLYKISFQFYIFSPEKALDFIKSCIENNFLVETDNHILKLSNNNKKKLDEWHFQRRSEIIEKIDFIDKISNRHYKNENNDSYDYKHLLKVFTDKGTINRAVTVPNSNIKLIEFSTDKGIIKSEVKGSEGKLYKIEIDINKKFLLHNCHDFESRRAHQKKFCKHILKLFLLLINKNLPSAEFFLNDLAENIDKWNFSSKPIS